VSDIRPHSTSDRLDLASPYGDGETWAVVMRGQFVVGQQALFLPAMNEPMVPTADPRFAFMAAKANKEGYARIRASRFKGEFSRGLMLPWEKAWDDLSDDQIAEALALKKYEPQFWAGGKSRPGYALGTTDEERGPHTLLPVGKYDVEGLFKGWRDIKAGQEVVLTEKVHGANACYMHQDGRLYVRSRTRFIKHPEEGKRNIWWDAAKAANLEEALGGDVARDASNGRPVLLYGEVYGQVQDLTYGQKDARFVLFDVYIPGDGWQNWDEVKQWAKVLNIDHVPELARMVWPEGNGIPEAVKAHGEGLSMLGLANGAEHVREGFVIRPVQRDDSALRTNWRMFKYVGRGYASR